MSRWKIFLDWSSKAASTSCFMMSLASSSCRDNQCIFGGQHRGLDIPGPGWAPLPDHNNPGGKWPQNFPSDPAAPLAISSMTVTSTGRVLLFASDALMDDSVSGWYSTITLKDISGRVMATQTDKHLFINLFPIDAFFNIIMPTPLACLQSPL